MDSNKILEKKLYVLLLCIRFILYISSSKVVFFVLNDENCITDLCHSEINLEMIFTENKSVECINEEEKITIFKNNILRYEEPSKQPKYYNPNIHTLHHWNNMLFNSKLIKKYLDSKSTNIKIFLKDISYPALLLFLKLIDNSDSFISQINLQDFLDILLIITILDIEKTKERDYFLKDLLRNVMFEMLRQDSTLYFDNNLCIYHYSYIKKSLFMDIWIFFINFITFDDKSAERFIILSKNIDLTFKSLDIYGNSYNSIKKPHETNFTIRLDNISINKTYKIFTSKFLVKTWIFFSRIANFDIIYLIFTNEETYEKAKLLWSNVTFYTRKLYIRSSTNVIELFLNKNMPIFWNKLKVLKLECNLTLIELKKLLTLCSNINKVTLKSELFDFERVRSLIDFYRLYLDKICKIFCQTYKLLNTDPEILQLMPKNLIFYSSKFQNASVDTEIPMKFIPFLHNYYHDYQYQRTAGFPTSLAILDCFMPKIIRISIEYDSPARELNNSVLLFMKYIKTIKYLFFVNIVLNKMMLIYFLETNTLVSIELVNSYFLCSLDFLSYGSMTNRNLKSLALNNLKSHIDYNFLIYLNRFKCIQSFMLIHTEIEYSLSPIRKICNFFHSFFIQENKKYLKNLEIKTDLNDYKTINILYFLSEVYDFSKLLNIVYCVYRITEIETKFFITMKKLESITLKIYHGSDCIDFEKLFNKALFSSVVLVALNVNRIREKDFKFFKLFKNLGLLSLSIEVLNYKTVSSLRKNNFKTTEINIMKPVRTNRSREINNFLDEEFGPNFF
ncbi:hypothetical protein CWI36_0526p0010 [Hamiltosporidium magnivora]|uniref:Uncharacterized protein n=1 Tax=Hamiltosporidium magnivora TaxID=148818 RepID=A0A4V2JW07_9MICR|nr:hypothetical protein CWI36_0526p0010 [Hamiltosporidium magnivora]